MLIQTELSPNPSVDSHVYAFENLSRLQMGIFIGSGDTLGTRVWRGPAMHPPQREERSPMRSHRVTLLSDKVPIIQWQIENQEK